MWRDSRLASFSQNLITEHFLIKRLIDKSDLTISDTVLDIGAGTGTLTKELSQVCGHVIAIEIDKSLYIQLCEIDLGDNVVLLHKDILDVKLPETKYKVFSNIPFNYTSRIMHKLYFNNNSPESAYIIMQKEASNIYLGTPRETQKSLLLKPFFDFEIIHEFNQSDFKPIPSVSIVMLQIIKKSLPLLPTTDKQFYSDFVVYGTTQYKPNILKSLKNIFTYEQLKRLAVKNNFSLDAKPLVLYVEQWIQLYKYYKNCIVEQKKILVKNAFLNQARKQKRLKKFYRTKVRVP